MLAERLQGNQMTHKHSKLESLYFMKLTPGAVIGTAEILSCIPFSRITIHKTRIDYFDSRLQYS